MDLAVYFEKYCSESMELRGTSRSILNAVEKWGKETHTRAASNLNLVATGESRADFSVHSAAVLLSGGSQATISLDGTLDANLSGGSQLQHIGTSTMGDIYTSGGSAIIKK